MEVKRKNTLADYKETAREARIAVLKMIYKAQTSHIGSNFSCIDLLTVLFDKVDIEKDKLVVSKGWVAASIYYFLAEKGLIPKKHLKRYCVPGEKHYIGLVEPRNIFGLEFAGGSMQMGTAAGVGYALAKKLKDEKGQVYVLESDGAMAGGMIWESLAIASHHKLNNFTLIIDNNGYSAMGRTKEIINIEPLADKLQSFGMEVRTINGHNYKEIKLALTYPRLYTEKPLIIIADTVKGKGVSFMEGDNLYHYKAPSKEEYSKALKELYG